MISNKEGLHYFTVQKLSALLRGLTSKHDKDFYCLNCVFSCRTKKKLKSYKLCGNEDFCDFTMPCEENSLLEFTQDLKSIKTPFLINTDFECLIK